MSLEEQINNMPDGIESDDVKELRNALYRLQKQLLKAKTKTEDLVEATHQAAYDAMLTMGPIKPVAEPKVAKGGKGKPEVALWHMTDWQGAKKTTTYNSNIMRKRVMEFAEKAVRITEIQRADHPVKECYILFGGDMVEGLFNFPGQAFEIDATLFDRDWETP